MNTKKTIEVAVVGAGAAGLCALRHLTCRLGNEPAHLHAVCFEQAAGVGGTWCYTDMVGTDENGLPIHSSMYKNLKTNLPVECMAFPDFPFPESTSFVGHEVVRKYLEDYAAHFDLFKHIKFQTIVTWIKPVKDEENIFDTRWEVTTKSVHDLSQEETSLFDAVLICNGHYAIPLIPDIYGLEIFSGEILHSHDYRKPSTFSGKKLVLLGASSSGLDISLELSPWADQLFLSHNKELLKARLPDNVHQKPGIKKVNDKQVEFLDGSKEDVDVLMFCTGYEYDYSFLDPECEIEVTESRVTPLYKHLIHTKYPNFGIIGVCKIIVPFPLFDVQVRFYRAILSGTLTLPSAEEMNKDTEKDYRERLEAGLPHRYAHVLSERQFDYNDEIADLAKTSRIPEHYKQLYFLTHKLKKENLIGYKNINFSLDVKEDKYVIIN